MKGFFFIAAVSLAAAGLQGQRHDCDGSFSIVLPRGYVFQEGPPAPADVNEGRIARTAAIWYPDVSPRVGDTGAFYRVRAGYAGNSPETGAKEEVAERRKALPMDRISDVAKTKLRNGLLAFSFTEDRPRNDPWLRVYFSTRGVIYESVTTVSPEVPAQTVFEMLATIRSPMGNLSPRRDEQSCPPNSRFMKTDPPNPYQPDYCKCDEGFDLGPDATCVLKQQQEKAVPLLR